MLEGQGSAGPECQRDLSSFGNCPFAEPLRLRCKLCGPSDNAWHVSMEPSPSTDGAATGNSRLCEPLSGLGRCPRVSQVRVLVAPYLTRVEPGLRGSFWCHESRWAKEWPGFRGRSHSADGTEARLQMETAPKWVAARPHGVRGGKASRSQHRVPGWLGPGRISRSLPQSATISVCRGICPASRRRLRSHRQFCLVSTSGIRWIAFKAPWLRLDRPTCLLHALHASHGVSPQEENSRARLPVPAQAKCHLPSALSAWIWCHPAVGRAETKTKVWARRAGNVAAEDEAHTVTTARQRWKEFMPIFWQAVARPGPGVVARPLADRGTLAGLARLAPPRASPKQMLCSLKHSRSAGRRHHA